MGSGKIFFFPKLPYCFIMSLPHNINPATVAPVIVNPESILVDSDLEEDLEEIQCEVVAEQAQIEEAAQARLAVAHECIEKKWKVKEEEARKVVEAWKAEEEEEQKVEEVRKAEEEEERKRKEEENRVVREKARKGN